MNIFGRRGEGKYEPNFTVVVEGLDRVVERAISGTEGEYSLGMAEMASASPLARVSVTLKTRTEPHRVTRYRISPQTKKLEEYSEVDKFDPSYTLEAAIMGDGSKGKLPTNTEFLKRAGFSVTAASKDVFLQIRNEKSFPKNTIVIYSGMSQKAQLSYGLKVAGLTHEDMGRTITGFAEALEAVVNGIYKAARKTPPVLTLELKLGEQVRRIKGKNVEGASRQSIPAAFGDWSGYGDETPAHPLEAVRSEVTFKDIGGYQSVKEQLGDFLLAIKNPAEASRQGYTPSKGWLLHGPPGTGKTLFGKALAGEAGAEFIYFNAADALQMYVGQSTKTLKAAFEGAQKRADGTKKPVMLFIDEIDSIFPKRGTAHDVKVDLVNLFNQYMDGFETKKIPNVYVVAATNRLHEMDEAATRAGRFVKVEVPLPDLEARVAIFQVTKEAIEREAGTQLFDTGIDYRLLAELSEKFSGADIAQIMRETRQKAFRQAATANQKAVVMTSAADLEEQISHYKTQKEGGSGKGPIGFGRR